MLKLKRKSRDFSDRVSKSDYLKFQNLCCAFYYIVKCVVKHRNNIFFLQIHSFLLNMFVIVRSIISELLDKFNGKQAFYNQILRIRKNIQKQTVGKIVYLITSSRRSNAHYINLNSFNVSFHNIKIKKKRMSQQQQQQQPQKPLPLPPMPFRYPFFPPPPFPDKMKNPPPITNPNMMPNPPSNVNPGQPPPFPNPRMYNPFFNGYNMLGMPQMGPFNPFMPMMRNPQMPPLGLDNSKITKEKQDKNSNGKASSNNRPIPPYFSQPMFMPPPNPFMSPPNYLNPFSQMHPPKQLLSKKKANGTSQKQPIIAQNANKKQTRQPQSSSSQTPAGKEQAKQKAKHSIYTLPAHEGLKKKRKKSNSEIEPSGHRETREKKQSIERVMEKVMQNKPKRDRVIRIGKEYQAFIPESFVNEYEYNLKIKLIKKQSLLNRMVTTY